MAFNPDIRPKIVCDKKGDHGFVRGMRDPRTEDICPESGLHSGERTVIPLGTAPGLVEQPNMTAT
jgi:hypothetical protein